MESIRQTDKKKTYEVKDADGTVVARHVRRDGPDGKKRRMWWESPDGTPGLNGMPPEQLPLYGSEHVNAWPEDDIPVVVAEGEKAAQALLDAGFRAVGTVTGAGGTPGPEALEVVRGHEAVLWPDNDPGGREHMDRIAERLQGIALKVRVFTWHDAPEKGDAADHPRVKDGSGREHDFLLNDFLCAPQWTPPAPENGLRGRVDIGQRIAEGADPPDSLVEGILYAGKIHALNSEPGEGKTNFALWAALEVMRKELVVLYLDAENGPALVAERLEDMGADPEMLSRLFHYYQSPEVTLGGDDLEDLAATAAAAKPALVVFDSLPDFLALAGLDENGAGDVTRWMALVAQPLKDAGASVLVLDHLTKSTEGRGRYARGSGAKLAKMDVSWSLSRTVAYDRETVGEVQMKLRKDREAYLPTSHRFAVGGIGIGLSFRRCDGVIEEPGPDDLTDSGRKGLDALKDDSHDEGATFTEWMRLTDMPKTTFRRVKDELLAAGRVIHDGKRYRLPDEHDLEPAVEGPQGPRPQDGPGVSGGAKGATTLKGGPNGPNPAPDSVKLRLYRLRNQPVETTQGRGILTEVKGDRVIVWLDSMPDRCTEMKPEDIQGPAEAAA